MRTKSLITKVHKLIMVLFVMLVLIFLCFPSAHPAAKSLLGHDPTYQTPELLYNEAQAVYLGNLERRNNGVPPLRGNLQLTHSARWFSWDSTENRPGGYCGHQDSQGQWPGYRNAYFGYLGANGAENAFCGYLSPADAIQGWMNSPGHRENLLDPNSREIGLGYYRRDSDGSGYVTQDFGSDYAYNPVVIENEAVSTSNPNVNLYIYDRLPGGGFMELGSAVQMMVSNNANFANANWEPYQANKAWTLAGGTGWREVYVRTRDIFNRTSTVSDSIYLGDPVPVNELGPTQMSTTSPVIILPNLDGNDLPEVQLSLGWLADDTNESFKNWWGNGERVNDPAAWGGTAYRLYPGNGESFAWVYQWKFPIENTPLVAYFRLKVNDNTSGSEVARISVDAAGTEYGPLRLQGSDFTSPDQYQEFALPFTFSPTDSNAFLTFQFWQSGTAEVFVDAVSIFTAPQPITSPLTWTVPGGNYRGQGVWVRYSDGSRFSAISEAPTVQLPIQRFSDVATDHWAWSYIERLYTAGITGGCSSSPLMYCPSTSVNRAQMAVFLLRAKYGSEYKPPAASGVFEDVPASDWTAPWIERLASEGITGGCSENPKRYCPTATVTRAQMAIFLLRAKHGSAYTPPQAAGMFLDVPKTDFTAAWIEQLANEQITGGCGGGNYCPAKAVTRDQMAVFLVKTFHLP
ncbi:MAG: CAP domain-containing protein [Syntrophothermus sp.]